MLQTFRKLCHSKKFFGILQKKIFNMTQVFKKIKKIMISSRFQTFVNLLKFIHITKLFYFYTSYKLLRF
jgi:hypothetical protein